MKLSEVKGEAALDLLAEIIEPMTKIMVDPKVKELAKNRNKIGLVKVFIKDHKEQVIEILAILDGISVDECKEKLTVITLTAKILEILNDPELVGFFISQGLMGGQTPSIAPMENTEEKEY